MDGWMEGPAHYDYDISPSNYPFLSLSLTVQLSRDLRRIAIQPASQFAMSHSFQDGLVEQMEQMEQENIV